MIVLGLILLVVGYIIGIAPLVTIGWVILAVGLILTLLGAVGHGIGGRKTYF